MSIGVQFPEHYKNVELVTDDLLAEISRLKSELIAMTNGRDYYYAKSIELSELVERNNIPSRNEDGI